MMVLIPPAAKGMSDGTVDVSTHDATLGVTVVASLNMSGLTPRFTTVKVTDPLAPGARRNELLVLMDTP